MKKGIKRIDAALMQSLPMPVILVNRDREIIEYNEAAAPFLADSAQGRDLALSLRHPNLLDSVDEVIAGKNRAAGEFVIPAPFAQTFQFTVVLLKEKKSTDFARALISLNDITSIRATEEMRADFVANVSHELRSPLSTLIGFIETLRGVGWDDDQARERFLGIMDTEAHRMKRLINDLLSLSKVEVREHVRPKTAVDVSMLVRETADTFTLRAEKREVAVSVDIEEDLPTVPGDPDELAEVFTNLIDNGLKYGDPKTEITIEATKIARVPYDGGEGVSVTVTNHGEGIAPEHIPRLTERFYRIDKGRSRELGGTGLGLAIVKHIVNRHRGRLVIRSHQNETTSFTVILPVA